MDLLREKNQRFLVFYNGNSNGHKISNMNKSIDIFPFYFHPKLKFILISDINKIFRLSLAGTERPKQ